jgi:hypothetical protein
VDTRRVWPWAAGAPGGPGGLRRVGTPSARRVVGRNPRRIAGNLRNAV